MLRDKVGILLNTVKRTLRTQRVKHEDKLVGYKYNRIVKDEMSSGFLKQMA